METSLGQGPGAPQTQADLGTAWSVPGHVGEMVCFGLFCPPTSLSQLAENRRLHLLKVMLAVTEAPAFAQCSLWAGGPTHCFDVHG